MYDFHKDKERYFAIQRKVTEEYIYPFISSSTDLDKSGRILEIGCAEAGVLKYFLERGHHCTGIELSPSRVELASNFLKTEIDEGRARIINKNIFDIDPVKDLQEKFDLILLKDVIEHIPKRTRFFSHLKNFIKPQGKIFFAFPPWTMPFGGHQQVCKNKLLNKTPWIHLLPSGLYGSILKMAGEADHVIKELLEIKQTKLSTNEFYRFVNEAGFEIRNERYWSVNPIYKYKFGLTPRHYKRKPLIFRDVATSCLYALISLKEQQA